MGRVAPLSLWYYKFGQFVQVAILAIIDAKDYSRILWRLFQKFQRSILFTSWNQRFDLSTINVSSLNSVE